MVPRRVAGRAAVVLVDVVLFLTTSGAAGQEAPPERPPEVAPPPSAPSTEERLERLEQRLGRVEEENRALRRAAEERAAAPPDLAHTYAAGGGELPLDATWRNGFFLSTSDGNFRLRIGELVQLDGRYFPGSEAPGVLDSFAIRSMRFETEGALWRIFDFKVNVDFAGGVLQI